MVVDGKDRDSFPSGVGKNYTELPHPKFLGLFLPPSKVIKQQAVKILSVEYLIKEMSIQQGSNPN